MLKHYPQLIITLVFIGFSVMQLCFASSTTKDFTVTANVTSGCEFKNSNDLNLKLPPIFEGKSSSSVQMSFQLICTPGVAINIALNNGEHPQADGTKQLLLTSPADQPVTLPYQVYYVNSSHNKQPWSSVALSGDTLNHPIIMEADVNATNPMTPGVYKDTLVMSITY